MTALDIIVILLVGGGAVMGGLRGFVTEVLSLFAWVLAILAVKFFHTPLSDMLTGPVGNGAGAATLAFLTYNFLFLQPRYSFAIGSPTDVLTLIVFWAVALTTGFLAGRVSEQARAAQRRAPVPASTACTKPSSPPM